MPTVIHPHGVALCGASSLAGDGKEMVDVIVVEFGIKISGSLVFQTGSSTDALMMIGGDVVDFPRFILLCIRASRRSRVTFILE